MFSSRIAWGAEPNAISRMLAGKEAAGMGVLDLTESNPTQAGFDYPEEELLAGFQDPRMLTYDPESAGLTEAREIIGRYCGVPADRLILTSSTSEAYSWLFKLLCNPGDEVLAPQPSYPLFDYLAALENVRPVPYPLEYHGRWTIDFDSLLAALSTQTRAIILVHPNNPTGSFVQGEELARLDELCRERGIALISDEVFSGYALEPRAEFVPVAAAVPAMAFSLNGLSKMIGMPQMKLGWIHTNSREAHERLELIADTYLSVGTPVQHALPALFGIRDRIQRQIRARLQENLATLKAGFSPRHVEGGWYAVLQVPRVRSEEEWVLALLEHENVLVQPGYFYDFASEAFLVLSLLTPPAVFEEGLRRINTFLHS